MQQRLASQNLTLLVSSFLLVVTALLLGPITASSARAGEPVDLDLVTRIRHEGFRNSQVMDHAWQMTDVFGARVSASPQIFAAQDWAVETLTSWGLENAHLESFEYGRGWSWSRCVVDQLDPGPSTLSALPQGWTPGTDGPVEGEAYLLVAETEEELEEHRGGLAGKIVMISELEEVDLADEAAFKRRTHEDMCDAMIYDIPTGGPSKWLKRYKKSFAYRQALDAFLHEEGALAIVEVSTRDFGIIRALRGGSPTDATPTKIPAVTMMTEQYNRILRLLEKEQTVRLRLDVDAEFHENDGMARNVVAEIPGRGKKDELVIVGAHLDSYQAATGAVDNAAGCAVMMEAVRILKALDLKPERTIRICLWSGEEQGLLGSKAHVDRHFASRPAWTDSAQLAMPRSLREKTGPLEYKKDWEKLSAYFNLDNGSGKIRGVYAEDNVAVKPIFEAWLAPFEDLGVEGVTVNRTSGTDHMSFDRVGLPGFQFIQDPMNYWPQLHHTHLDGYDHLHADDLKQAAVVVASLLIHTANRDELLPRKPKPQEETR